jgi:hypothetical protein
MTDVDMFKSKYVFVLILVVDLKIVVFVNIQFWYNCYAPKGKGNTQETKEVTANAFRPRKQYIRANNDVEKGKTRNDNCRTNKAPYYRTILYPQ